MIERYQTPEMKELWSDENKFKTWLKVEIAAVEVLCEHGIVPEASLKIIKKKAKFNKDRILCIEDIPPPTVRGIKTSSAVFWTMFSIVFLFSKEALISKKQISSAPFCE